MAEWESNGKEADVKTQLFRVTRGTHDTLGKAQQDLMNEVQNWLTVENEHYDGEIEIRKAVLTFGTTETRAKVYFKAA